MGETWEHLAVGAMILGAVIYLLRHLRKSGCEKGGCGCDAKKLAASLSERKDG